MTDPRRRPPAPDTRHTPRTQAPDNTEELPVVALDGSTPDDPTMPPPTPRRLAAATVVVFVAVLTGGIIFGAGLNRPVFALGILGLQLLLIGGYVLHRRPPGPLVTAGVGVITAVAADWVAMYSSPFSLDKLVYVLAGAFLLTIIGQVLRGGGRKNLTISMGASLYLAALVTGYATLIGLTREGGGRQALWVCAIAVGAAVMAARAIDVTMPNPRINRQVTRGAFGIVIGAMVGTAAAAYAGVLLDGPTPAKAALGGLIIGLVGVLGDLSAGYQQAGRRIAGEGVAIWPVRHGIGPLMAFATAAPVAYLLSVYYIVRGI